MKKQRISTYFFSVLTLFFSASAVVAAVFFRDAKPVLLLDTEEVSKQVCILMDAVCSGNFEQAEELLYGNPSLGTDRAPADYVGEMIWQSYINSLDYQLVGDVYATDAGIAQDVKIISMEIPTAVEQVGNRAQTLLNEKIRTAEDVSELYDQNNEYREELVNDILEEAVRQALEEDVRYSYRIVTLRLIYSRDRWQVVADQNLLQAISGGIAG